MNRNARRPAPGPRHGPSDQLREIIASRGITAYALGRDAGVAPNVIQRFLNHQRDIRLDTFDRLAAVLKVRLAEVGNAPRRNRPTPPTGSGVAPIATPPDGASDGPS